MFDDADVSVHAPESDPTEQQEFQADSMGEDHASYPGVSAGDLAVSAGGHYLDAGPATYDLDGDGRAETAIVEADGRIVQVSDTDGDGRADEMLQVETSTQDAAILTDDGSGDWQVEATGHLDSSGDFVAGQTAVVDHPISSGADDSGADRPDIVYAGVGGQTDLGAPDQDLDGDGVAESVAIRTSDGDVLLVSDINADGHPDQIIQIDGQTGEATWGVPDGHGGWDVVQTGHLDADGALVVDPEPPATDQGQQHGELRPVATPATPDPSPTPATAEHEISVAVDGRSFDAGPATIDSDGDGVADTVQVAGPGGSTLFYQDGDGDGVADKAWSTDESGQVTATFHLDADGGWAAAGDTS